MNERLKAIRKALSLNQTEFGERLGVTVTAISKLEKGQNNLTDQMLLAVCREYNVNEEWLRTGAGDMFARSDHEEVSRLANDYMLDDLDCKIIESYIRLSKYQRQAIKRFIMDVAESEMEVADEIAPAVAAAPAVQKELSIDEKVTLYRARLEAAEKGPVESSISEKDA